MVASPSDNIQSHKVSGQKSPRGRVSGEKSLKNPENPEKLGPGRGGRGGYWGGRPLWDISTYLHQHNQDITQTFMVDSPIDNIQTHKILGRKSPEVRVGQQKKSKSPKIANHNSDCRRSRRSRIRDFANKPWEPHSQYRNATGAARA